MPKKKLSDENANVPPHPRKQQRPITRRDSDPFLVKKPKTNGPSVLLDKKKKRKILQQTACNVNNFSSDLGGMIPRDIREFVETQQRQNSLRAYGVDGEQSLLQQLAEEFEMMNVRVQDGPPNREPLQDLKSSGLNSMNNQVSTKWDSQIGLKDPVGYLSCNTDQFTTNSKIQVFVDQAFNKARNCKRFSVIRRNLNRTSFRSTSILSQSTPPPPQVDLNKKESPLLARLERLRNPEATQTGALNELPEATFDRCAAAREDHTNCIESNMDVPAESEIMTQLASQLSEVVLSPCLAPIACVDAELYSFNELELNRKCSLKNTSISPKRCRISSSLTLGYIDIAFPEKIELKDLRLVI